MVTITTEFDREKLVNAITNRRLVTVRTIDALSPIEGKDRIEVATVDGWKVIVKKGEFQVGDPCVYFEIDSFLPDGNAAWQFLVDKQPKMFNGQRGHKLRTVKMGGQVSQGFVVPLSVLPIVGLTIKEVLSEEELAQVSYLDETRAAEFKNIRYGIHEHEAQLSPRDMDYSALLGVVKWDPPLPAELQGQAAGLFPSFIQKTDQERAQNMIPEIFGFEGSMFLFDTTNIPEEAVKALHDRGQIVWVSDDLEVLGPRGDHAGGAWYKVIPAKGDPDAEYEITIKMDGSSMTAFVKKVFVEEQGGVYTSRIGVCSRNLELKISDANADNSFVRMLRDSKLDVALEAYFHKTGREIAVQGELMGPGIQGNRENLTAPEFFLFDIQDITTMSKLPPQERVDVYHELLELGADPLKFRHSPILNPMLEGRPPTIKFLKLSDIGVTDLESLLKFAEGESLNNSVREGVVFKRKDGLFSFKVISNVFLLGEKD